MSVPSLSEALALMNRGELVSARALCQRHLARRPDDFNARHLLGLVEFKAGNLIAASKELTRASQLDQPPRFRAQALNNLALVLQARGRLEQATEACRQAVQLQPNETAFHLNLLGLLEQQRLWPAMQAHLDTHPALAGCEEARLFQAVALRQLGQYPAALAILDRLSSSIEVESERALNRCLLGHSQAVIESWQHAGAEPDRLIRLADYIAEEGHPRAATPLYAAAAAVAPDNQSVRHMLDAASGRCTAEAPARYIRDLYDTHAEQFESRLQDRLGYRAPTLLCHHLAGLLQDSAPLRAADLGCGTGLCGVELRRQLPIAALSGCDLSPAMLKLAARKQVYDSLSCCALTDYLAQLTPVELITATDVLIYTGNLERVFAAVARALTAGGLFAFTVEHNRSEHEVCLHASGRYRHSRQHLRTLAERHGFTFRLLEAFPLRLENAESIEGLMVILQRA